MKKNTQTFEDKLQRMREISGIKTSEPKVGTPTTIIESTKGIDNVNYVIVKEEGSYYIKTTKSDVINESTIDYIGGLKNKIGKFKYDSYAEALKNLNMMMITLNESWNFEKKDEDKAEDSEDKGDESEEKDEDAEKIEERFAKDINDGSEGIPPAPGEGGEVPMDQPAPAAPSQDAAPAPMPEPAPEPQAEPAAPAPEPEPEMGGEAPLDAPAPQGDEGLADDDSDLEDPAGDPAGEGIDHFVGKLTAEIRNAGQEEMNPDKIKSIMNSIISALPLNFLPAEERLVLARRIKRGGQKEKSEMDEISIPMDEIITPLDKPTSQFKNPHDFDQQDDLKINEFFDKIDKTALIAEENKIQYNNILIEGTNKGNLVLTNGDKKFKFNVSEATFNKFQTLTAHEPINEGLKRVEDMIKKLI